MRRPCHSGSVAILLSRRSAGGQLEQPWAVKSSTTTGFPVAVALGAPAGASAALARTESASTPARMRAGREEARRIRLLLRKTAPEAGAAGAGSSLGYGDVNGSAAEVAGGPVSGFSGSSSARPRGTAAG